jgi:hypothetical protein
MEGLVVRGVRVCAVMYEGKAPNSTELPPCVCGEMNESISEGSGLREVTALIWCYRFIKTCIICVSQNHKLMHDFTSIGACPLSQSFY